ncbi:MAG: hypothetical protein IPO82_10245 [Betaproteobacteria bacterium]|nr:hypothetical protein [Betaproteobacteria bacterium]
MSTKAWAAALERAGIEDFRWHDLRHTPSELACAEPDAAVRLRKWGWSVAEMVRRYAHLAADHLALFAERLCALRAVDVEIVGTKGHSPQLKGPSRKLSPRFAGWGGRLEPSTLGL